MSTTERDELPPFDLERSIGRRREDFLQALSYVDLKVKNLERQCDATYQELKQLRTWAEEDRRRSAWYYDNKNHLEAIVEGSKWATTTRKVVMMLAGAILGAIMFMQALWPYLKKGMNP